MNERRVGCGQADVQPHDYRRVRGPNSLPAKCPTPREQIVHNLHKCQQGLAQHFECVASGLLLAAATHRDLLLGHHDARVLAPHRDRRETRPHRRLEGILCSNRPGMHTGRKRKGGGSRRGRKPRGWGERRRGGQDAEKVSDLANPTTILKLGSVGAIPA